MAKKVLKQFLCMGLIILTVFSTLGVDAFYFPGDRELVLEDIIIATGESYEVSFYLPFDSSEIVYTQTGSGTVTLNTGRQTVTLLKEGTTSFTWVERAGQKTFTFTVVGEDATLSGVKILQNNTSRYDESVIGTYAPVCEQTEQAEAISTAVLVNSEASCIVVNGARRYINNDNVKETPQLIDGSMYLPARVLALSLGCYYEDIPEKNYIMIRCDESEQEFYFTATESYMQQGRGEKKTINYRPVYLEGKPYLPVRGIAQMLGKKVNWKDNIAIIDDAQFADKILEAGIFRYVENIFKEFIPKYKQGKVYHVSTDNPLANDNNDGTEAQPFKSINKAAQVAVAGDTILIHKGIYREKVTPLNSGTATNPIVFKEAGDGEVVIAATKKIDNFKTVPGEDYVAADVSIDLGDGRNQIFYKDGESQSFYDNECIVEARYPNADGNKIDLYNVDDGLSSLFPIQGDLKLSPEDNTLVTSESLLQEPEDNYWAGGTFLSVHGSGYSLSAAKIESSEKGKLVLDADTLPSKYWSDASDMVTGWNWGYISGHKNAMDLPGEWVVKNGQLLIIPPEGESADTLSVEMKERQVAINLSNKKFINIIGIKIFGGSAVLKDSEMCILNNLDMKYISHYTYSDDQREGYIDMAITASTLASAETGAPERGEVGVYISGKDNAVVHSRFDHSAAAALYMSGLYQYVDDNIISNCGYMGSYVSGITVYDEPWKDWKIPKGGFSIYNNTVYNSGRYLFVTQGKEGRGGGDQNGIMPFLPFEVAYNDFHDGSLFTLDVGYVYGYFINGATERQSSKIHGNYIYTTSSRSNPYSFGLYCDGGSMGIDGYNNVIYATDEGVKFTTAYAYKNATMSTCTLSTNAEIKTPVRGNIIAAEQFPNGKPFYAGALQGSNPYLQNYNQIDETVAYIPANSGTSISNATVEGDGVAFREENATVTFKNVDMTGKNQISLYYGGDGYKYGDIIRIDVGGDVYEVFASTKSKKLYETDYLTLPLTETKSGAMDIVVSMPSRVSNASNSGDTMIYGLLLSSKGEPRTTALDGSNVSAADYSKFVKLKWYGDVAHAAEGYKKPHIKSTYKGTKILYKNVNIAENVSILNVKTAGKVSRDIKVTVDSSPQVTATITVNSGSWEVPMVERIVLGSTLPAGIYDVYVEFDAASNTSTCDFYSFGFEN